MVIYGILELFGLKGPQSHLIPILLPKEFLPFLTRRHLPPHHVWKGKYPNATMRKRKLQKKRMFAVPWEGFLGADEDGGVVTA